MDDILNVTLFFFFFYAVLPTLLARLCHIGIIQHASKGSKKVAITFDDGPDPKYTPVLLEILKCFQVRACFFILGTRAKKHPDIIARIIQEGHEIGNHCFRHRLLWFLGPWATIREIVETSKIIKELTGKQSFLFRPPWGLFNAFSFILPFLRGQKVILWSFMSWDWAKRTTPEKIAASVLKKVRDGSILIFHDSESVFGAARGAPEKMLSALPLILNGLRQKRLQVAPLGELTGTARHFTLKPFKQRIWQIWERIFIKLSRLKDIDEDKPGGSFFKLAVKNYKGQAYVLPDGTVISKGDLIGELHLNNYRLQELIAKGQSVEKVALLTMRAARNSFRSIAALIEENTKYHEVKAFMGITLLHQVVKRLGFTVFDLQPGWLRFIATFYQKWLLIIFHPKGFRRLKDPRNKLVSKMIAISREELLRRYLH